MKIRALLIDPHLKEVREVVDDFDDYRIIKQYLAQGERGKYEADLGTTHPLVENTALYCDDLGCYREGQAWWKPQPWPYGVPGYGVIAGLDHEGGTVDIPDWLTPEKIAPLLVWPDAVLAQQMHPATTITSRNQSGQVTAHSSFPIEFERREPYRKANDG